MQQHLMRGVGLLFTEIYTIKLKRPGAKPDPSLKKEYPLKMKCRVNDKIETFTSSNDHILYFFGLDENILRNISIFQYLTTILPVIIPYAVIMSILGGLIMNRRMKRKTKEVGIRNFRKF